MSMLLHWALILLIAVGTGILSAVFWLTLRYGPRAVWLYIRDTIGSRLTT